MWAMLAQLFFFPRAQMQNSSKGGKHLQHCQDYRLRDIMSDHEPKTPECPIYVHPIIYCSVYQILNITTSSFPEGSFFTCGDGEKSQRLLRLDEGAVQKDANFIHPKSTLLDYMTPKKVPDFWDLVTVDVGTKKESIFAHWMLFEML